MALAAVRIPVALPETDAGKRPARRDDRATGVASPNPAFAIAASLSTGDPVRRSLREPWLGRMPAPYGQQSVRPRQTISRVQDRLDGIPVVCDGWAARVVRFSDGRRQILSFVLPGDLVSVGSVFADSLAFFVEAITPVRYAMYGRAAFGERLAADPELASALMSACLAEMDEADRLAANLGRRRAEERIASLILQLRERLDLRGLVEDDRFEFPLRQKHVADATGLTPVHVNRVMGSLRSGGLIEMTGGKLAIADRAGLERLADLQ